MAGMACGRGGWFGFLVVLGILGGAIVTERGWADDAVQGPRAAAWQRVQKAFDEGKPKTALEALAGVEQAAVADKAWAEVARAIASRILAETGDRPPDDPERLILLAGAIDKAPAETRGVLEAIRANWTWGFFQQNRWRFQQRTQGGADAADLTRIAEWDLPTIVAEIRTRFTAAVGAEGSPQRRALQALPVADWSALLRPGTMSDAYRPTVWDVVARDALEFAASGERGLVNPEDAFELDADSPALGTMEEFLSWKPEADPAVTDSSSPLLEAARLYRALIAFHHGDKDSTALLAADLDRILWAAGSAVGPELADRKQDALEAFIERAADHETASLARFHLATLLQEQGDLVAARTLAAVGAESHPKSAGGAQCANLVTAIEQKELALVTERAWAEPWPVVRVNYRNLDKVHLRVCKADWQARLRAGRPHPAWLDDADRAAILGLPAVREHAADLPATPDFRQRQEDIAVAEAIDAKSLEPGCYWVIASQRADFGEQDNVVAATMVRVTRLAIVSEQARPVFEGQAGAARARRPQGPGGLSGYVVDIATGEPVAGAAVKAFAREQGPNQQGFAEVAAAATDKEGRYDLAAPQGREIIVVATAALGGKTFEAASDSTHVWPNVMPAKSATIVLVIDRGIHRPGQIVFYKGIASESEFTTGTYRAVADRDVEVVLRDANGREVAKARQRTSANGSFHGNFPIATGALPGQWSLMASGGDVQGAVGVRVEEYKRPKFQVKLAAPAAQAVLGGEVSVAGTATTYTGLAVADAKVAWRVERLVRWPLWCRWFFPGLPFGGEAQRIARGTARTDADGKFTVAFSAKPDRSVPRESLPVFTYRVVADVTDPGGETRSDERSVSAGYTDVEATLAAAEWQAVVKGEPAAVAITLATTTLDGEPRAAAGTLTVAKLVQPQAVARGDILGDGAVVPMPRPARRPRPQRGGRPAVVRPAPQPARPDPANPETWEAGAAVFTEELATEKASGKIVATAHLPAGIYRATFEIPARGDVPAVKATMLVEVVDPAADRYGVKRPFVMKSQQPSVEPGGRFEALLGTGYGSGRALVEVSRAGEVLERFWTDPQRTQWPLAVKVGDEHRGGFTVRAWMVREGRLRTESQVVDVPWTNKKLSITWERFTRRLEPGAKEVWRAKIASVADPVSGPAAPAVAEMAATLYDQSLDALAAHQWPGDGLMNLFRREWGGLQVAFTNAPEGFNHVRGNFAVAYKDVPATTYRALRDPFGSPAGGHFFGVAGGMARNGLRMMRRGGPGVEELQAFAMADAVPAAAAAPMAKAANQLQEQGQAGERLLEKDKDGTGASQPAAPAAAAAAPPPRKNLVETAFFLPTLVADKEGTVTIEFTLPDTLTTWQFKGLAHDARLRSATIADTCVSAKDLMVEPLVPRFLREGDVVQLPVKVSNTSTGRLAGSVRLELADARTNDDRSGLISGPREQPFDLAAGESKPVVFTVKVADGTDVLRYLATGTAGKASDGEEALLPVLPRRVLVTETVPVTIRGPGERKVKLERLAASKGTAIESQSLVVQAASNPAWYAVLALPCLMEEADESTETLFTRLYANSLARHLATSDPRIARVFEQWRGTAALESPLEKNTDLVKTLLAETPWVRDAVDEKEARARIGLLFDATRAANETQAALNRLEALRAGDGGWPWFPGGRTCDSVTLGIIAGFGRLRVAGVDIDVQPALRAIPWLDGRLVEERRWAEKVKEPVLTPIGVYALYARSFFSKDVPPQGEAAAAVEWGLGVGRKTWMKLDARRSQGQLAIALKRAGDRDTALSIVDSLEQRAVDADVKPGAEKESWQGMWWRDRHPCWWSWASAPIETQAIMIEAFDEVAGDAAAVEALKVWLLSQKRTSRWPGNRATADAVGALLGRGGDLLAAQQPVAVTVGGERVQPEKIEAGTGFFETRLVRREITPAMAAVTLEKPEAGLAWGGVHWQYLDDIANVPAVGREELAVEKKLFVKRFTKAGPELVPAKDAQATTVELGDELVVRLVVTSDRDYEFLELADHRPSLTEPVDVLSGWRFADGAGWYVAVRDTSTQMFFERLPRGTHVFEYSLRAAHRGTASSGFATIRSRYAPEFSAHSASVAIEVR